MVKGNVIKAVKGEKAWVTYAKRRVKDNQNFVAVVTGETGSGKSYSALSYCLQIDPTFNPKKQVVFYFKDLMQLINDDEFHNREWKIIMWDEIQIEMSNRKWQSKLNQSIIQLLSTFRAQNIILLMTAPNKSMLDAQVKKLLHAEIKCKGFIKKTSLCKLMPRYSQYNPDKDRIYPHKLMHNIGGKGYIPVDIWYIGKAPKEVLRLYEDKKTQFNIDLNRKIESNLMDNSKDSSTKGYDQTEKIIELLEQYGDNPVMINKHLKHLSLKSIETYIRMVKKGNEGNVPNVPINP